jgi:MoxR-like ATPase
MDSWKGYLVGVLADDDYVAERTGGKQAAFVNSLQVIQFAVRPLSPMPASLPQVKLLYGFSNDLERHGFVDDFALPAEERVQGLRDFLDGQLLVFRPVQRGQYFNIANLFLVAQPLNHQSDSTYLPIPAFNQRSCQLSFQAFAAHLAAGEPVGRAEHLAGEAADTPHCVVWRESALVESWLVAGSFYEHQYDQQGLKLMPDGPLRVVSFQENWDNAIFEAPCDECLLFVSQQVHQEMLDFIRQAEPYCQSMAGEQLSDRGITLHNSQPSEVGNSLSSDPEQQFLERLQRTATRLGLLYSPADLVNLHTAMKTSRLVILAGLSGTGKSRLMHCYAEALGLPAQQTWLIPVRPSWTDDADLIGFVDSEQSVFRPGDSGLVQALLYAAAHPEQLHLVCLDEMNLARVEHYFSQLLSVLELPPEKRVLRLYADQLEPRLLNSHQYPATITLGENLLFGGTVNLDESTYHFSDKVLDRANVIRLEIQPFADLQQLVTSNTGPYQRGPEVTAKEYRRFSRLCPGLGLQEREISLLQDIHNLLQQASPNLGIGYRVVCQIGSYLANLPSNPYFSRADALDKQLLQRIFTKIRGPESQLQQVIGSYRPDQAISGRNPLLDILDRYHELSLFRHSKQALLQKAKDLSEHGYTV